MLPIPVLDNEGFREIAENARRMIPRIYPEWTDHNDHDPGITFLQLFAFLKESQQYHLDQISDANRLKYLKLLGMCPRHRTAASGRAVLGGLSNPFLLPRGTQLYAGEIPFETAESQWLGETVLEKGYVGTGGQFYPFTPEMGSDLRLTLFEEESGELYLGFRGTLTAEHPLRLWMRVKEDYPVHRNPLPEEGFTPLVTLAWEYWNEDHWTAFTVLRDETAGLLFAGELRLGTEDTVTGGSSPSERLEEGFIWVRGRILEGGYDLPPVLTGVSGDAVAVHQEETLAECSILPITQEGGMGKVVHDGRLTLDGGYALYIKDDRELWRKQPEVLRETREGFAHFSFPMDRVTTQEALLLTWEMDFASKRKLPEGNGFPNQTYTLPLSGLLYEKTELLVEEPGCPGGFRIWEKVVDFDSAKPEDTHYQLDEEAGTITFGNGFHGVPPEGEILLAGIARTAATEGNIKAGQLRTPEKNPFRAEVVDNPENFTGGVGKESLEGCFARCRRLLRQTDRAVTYEDYENLVRETPGLMIANCKAVPITALPERDGSFLEDMVTVVVEPYAEKPVRRLSTAYTENILHHLETRRMLGTAVAVQPPEYADITIYGEILSQPHYIDAKRRITEAVEEFFKAGWTFGSPVRYSVLYGILDTLPCVAGIETLTIDAQGKNITRGVNGDVLLPYNGLAVLKSVSFQVRPVS